MKKNEVEEVSEEQVAELKADSDMNKAKRLAIQKKSAVFGDKCQIITQSTDKSLETVFVEITKKFRYGIIVVRHEQSLPVDNVCSNLSLKHNLLYVSTSRLIHNEIANCSEMGKKLVESRKMRELEKYG